MCCLALRSANGTKPPSISDCTSSACHEHPSESATHQPTSPLSPQLMAKGTVCHHHPPPPVASRSAPSPLLFLQPRWTGSTNEVIYSRQTSKATTHPNPPYRQPPSALQNLPILARLYARQRKPSKFIVPFYPLLLQTVERLSMHAACCSQSIPRYALPKKKTPRVCAMHS